MKKLLLYFGLLLLVAIYAVAETPESEVRRKVNTVYGVAINSTYGNAALDAQIDSLMNRINPELGAALTAVKQCSAYVADGTSEIDTTLENIRAAMLAVHTALADGTGEIDTTLENVRVAIALALAALADGTGEVDTTLENVRLGVADVDSTSNNSRARITVIESLVADGTSEIDTTLENARGGVNAIQLMVADGTGEIDTTLENVRTAMALVLAATADGTGEIDTTLENVRLGVADTDSSINNTRARVTAIEALLADGTSEIDTTLENVRLGTADADSSIDNARARVTVIESLLADGTSEIDTTLENIRAATALTYVAAADADSTGDATQLRITAIEAKVDSVMWHTSVMYVNHVKSDSVWSSVGEHEVFTSPDGVEIEGFLTIRDSIATDGADSLGICIGDGTSNILTKFAKVDWDVGEYVTFAPASLGTYRVVNPQTFANFQLIGDGMAGTGELHFVTNGADLGYNVQTATTITSGYSIWTLVWRHKSGSGDVANGAGGDL